MKLINEVEAEADMLKKSLFDVHNVDEKNVSLTELESVYMQLFLFKHISC